MKSTLKRCAAAFLILVITLPPAALAADNRKVLLTIHFRGAVSSVSVSGNTTAILTVPRSYGDTADLSSGLDITYDTSVCSAAVASFPSGSLAAVDGEAVPMRVSYMLIGDETIYTTTYLVSVVATDYTGPVFSGAITKSFTLPYSLTLSASDFSGNYTENDGQSLGYIAINGSNPRFGTLKYNGDNYYFGDLISVSKLNSGRLVFEATAAGTVSYTVTAYAAGDSTTEIGPAVLTITANAAGTGMTADAIIYSSRKDSGTEFSRVDFRDVCEHVTGGTLDYVRFTLPPSSSGTLYYDYVTGTDYDSKVTESVKYYYSDSPHLHKVMFVPHEGYAGTATVTYTAYDTDGQSYTGKVNITVAGDEADPIVYIVPKNTAITLDRDDFNDVCGDMTGEELFCVEFTLPPSSFGKLCYDYVSSSNCGSNAGEGERYYYSGSPYLNKLAFVPCSDYAGTGTIAYTAYNADGRSYTGGVNITVYEAAAPRGSDYFADVDSSYFWAVEAIDFLREKAVVVGMGDSKFNPGDYISRADFILMAYRAFGLSATMGDNFTDVGAGSYYYDAVGVAKTLGIATGSNGRFYPTAKLTRQDAMVLILRTLKAKSISIPVGTESDIDCYSDAGQVSDYAREAAASLTKAGIIRGSDNSLNPLTYIRRAEMAVLLYRALNL